MGEMKQKMISNKWTNDFQKVAELIRTREVNNRYKWYVRIERLYGRPGKYLLITRERCEI